MVTLKGKQVPIKMWARVEEVESAALTQLKNIAALPWCFSHVAVMPDVHLGKGATVGSVVAMKDAVAPAAVGVDIGCGMAAQRTSLHVARSARQPARAARGDRGRDPGRLLDARTTPGCRTTQSLFDEFGALTRRGAVARGQGAQAARHARRRQPLHRALPRHRGSRVAHAALGLAQHRQGAGRDPHQARARSSRTTARCPIAIWRCSSPARARWPSTVATSSGRSATRRSTAR